jgi:hypothetical protein
MQEFVRLKRSPASTETSAEPASIFTPVKSASPSQPDHASQNTAPIVAEPQSIGVESTVEEQSTEQPIQLAAKPLAVHSFGNISVNRTIAGEPPAHPGKPQTDAPLQPMQRTLSAGDRKFLISRRSHEFSFGNVSVHDPNSGKLSQTFLLQPQLQRKCAACEEEDEQVMRQADPTIIQREIIQREIIQRDGAGSLPPVPNYQLTPPSLLQPPDPASQYRLGGNFQLQLDPQIQAMAMQYVQQQFNPATLQPALSQIRLGLVPPSGTNPAATQGSTAPNPFATPTPVPASTPTPAPASPESEEPEPTRAATTDDLIQAGLQTPIVQTTLNRLGEQVMRDWHRLRTGEQIGVVSALAVVSGGAFAAILPNPDARRIALSPLNGQTVPVPGVNWLRLELNTADDNLMFGLHVDVGRLLPPSFGFGAAEPKAIGAPPEPEPLPGQRMIQRKADQAGIEGTIAQRIQATSGSGSKLDEGVQQHLEQHLGADLSNVRIHTDSEADRLSRSVNAVAFTTGQDIFFSSGSYNPTSTQGQHLIAHEVVHTVQQANGAVAGTPTAGGVSISNPSDSFEQEAEQVASQINDAQFSKLQQRTQKEVKPIQNTPSVQRWTMPFLTQKSDQELIRDAIDNKSIVAIKEINDFSKATESEKLTMLGMLSDQWAVGFRDARAIRSIWLSFGDKLIDIASVNIGLWKKSHAAMNDNGQYELEQTGPIKDLKKAFPADIKAVAQDYLKSNRAMIEQEMAKLGIQVDEKAPATTPSEQQNEEIQKLQETLKQVANAQAARKALSEVYVGYIRSYDPGDSHTPDPMGGGERVTEKPIQFTPGMTPPEIAPKGNDPVPMQPYASVKDSYEELSTYISTIANKYPAVYAVVAEGDSGKAGDAATPGNANPQEAQRIVGEKMREVLKNITKTEAKLDDTDLILDLLPIQHQLLSGKAASSQTQWSKALPKWVAEKVKENHEEEQFWLKLGLGSLAAAAFVIAEFATAGTATFFLAAGVGLGVSAAGVAMDWDKAMTLATAAKSSAKDNTALVAPEQMDAAMGEAILATALAILAAAGVVLKGVSALRGPSSPIINWESKLASGGSAGSLGAREGFGVFEGRVPGVSKPVAIKVYPANHPVFEQDMLGAQAASRTGMGPKFYGEVPAGPGKRAFAMEKVEGGFTEALPSEFATSAEILAAEKEAAFYASKVTQQTITDMEAYSQQLLKGGHYYEGEVQGMVSNSGRWRPIDFQAIRPLPPQSDKAAFDAAVKMHNDMFNLEKNTLQKLAQKNAAGVGP